MGNAQNPQIMLQNIITSHVLTRLPVKSLLRFKCVSRQWLSVISSPDFAQSHLKHSKENPVPGITQSFLLYKDSNFKMLKCSEDDNEEADDDKKEQEIWDMTHFKSLDILPEYRHIVGSCNGLVCIYVEMYGYFCIYNPCINEHCLVPCPLTCCYDLGFGYVSSTDDYKIFAYGYKDSPGDKHFVRSSCVYSFRANRWKKVGKIPKNFRGWTLNGLVFDEKLFWWIREDEFVGFDLKKDAFFKVTDDDDDDPLGYDFCCDGLCVLNRSLCVYGSSLKDNEIEFWMYDSSRSWSKFLAFEDSYGSEGDNDIRGFHGVTQSGKIFMQLGRGKRGGQTEFRLLDLAERIEKYVAIVRFEGGAVSYEESLVSPLDLLNNKKGPVKQLQAATTTTIAECNISESRVWGVRVYGSLPLTLSKGTLAKLEETADQGQAKTRKRIRGTGGRGKGGWWVQKTLSYEQVKKKNVNNDQWRSST